MDNKYYTPEIKEFHVDFEYETYMMSNGGYVIWDMEKPTTSIIKEPTNHIWFTVAFKLKEDGPLSTPYSLEQINKMIAENRIRVKHLDKEDIESLGWKYEFTNEYGFDVFKLNTFKFALSHNKSILMYGDKNEFITINLDIKNKSEFKRLLKQLNLLS